ncbi:MAG TPA: EAL domain-containing protein [Macromonas sp.]|nr:EAL domain-containing protein [Macromonas sp.]
MNARLKNHKLLFLETPPRVDRERVLNTLINNLEGMAYRCLNDADWTMMFVSQGCLELTGYESRELLQDGTITWEELTHPDDRFRVRKVIGMSFPTGQRFAVEYRIRTRNGAVKWVVERGVAVTDETGQRVVEGFIEDVTQQHQTQEALEHAEKRYRHIFEHVSEGIFQSSKEGTYLAANPALARMYGYGSTSELITGLSNIEGSLYVRETRREEFCLQMALNGKVTNFESEVYRRDGSKIWISENAHSVYDAKGRFVCYEGTVQDITERRQYQAQLERQANHDLLTGLPNRNLLGDRLGQAISRALRSQSFLGVVFIDLDNFKFINDTLGHVAGDALLVEIAQRLQGSIRASDTVARQGGDEFVLLLNDHDQVDTIITQLERVMEVVARPVSLMGSEYQVGASLGVALYPQDGRDPESLLKHADVAMYAAKSQGRNNFQFFTPDLNLVASERLTIEAALRGAIEQGTFMVHYQPKMNPQGRIVGAEALARWQHADFGWVSPDRFIPVAEETGLILPLTEIVLAQAFRAASGWPVVDGQPIRVAVNLSPKLFLGDDIVRRVARLLEDAGLPPDRVELEITESVFLGNDERALRILKAFKSLGVHLAMDDFGTGYSSLSYLRRFPLDIIKIDRSLVTDVEQDGDGATIAQAVIALARGLHKTVVAEGVEHPSQFCWLKEQGCDEFQGYLFSRPLPAEVFEALLARPVSVPVCGTASGG